NAGTRRVTLQPFSSGQLIDVGEPDAVGRLGLDSTDLGNITAATLQIGNGTRGRNRVFKPITLTTVTTLDPATGRGVVESGGSPVSVTDLAIRAVTNVSMLSANSVSTLAANVTGSGQFFDFVNTSSLAIGTVDGFQGITTNNGAIVVIANGNLTVNN